jgi:hypothetical protein
MKLHANIFLFLLLIFSVRGFAQQTAQDGYNDSQNGKRDHKNIYFSWGYGKFWYPKTDIHIKQNSTDVNQNSTSSEYTLHKVMAHDRLGIEKLYNVPLTVPQFCVRVGFFFNETQDLGVELTYDHAKFITSGDQYVRMTGATNGVAFDSTTYLYTDTSMGPKPFVFKLNNGANFFEFNLVKKFHLYKNRKIDFSYIVKCGAGWNTPHVENTVFGEKNVPHFQAIGGWNVGAESALRCVFFNHTYLEFGQKGVYASYYKLRIANGLANLHFAAYEVVLSLGVNFPEKIHKHYD